MAKKSNKTIEKLTFAGLGILVRGKKGVEKLADELVRTGEVSSKEGKKVAKEFKKRIEEDKKFLEKKINQTVMKALQDLGVPTRKEMDKLKSKVEKLDKKKR